MMSSRMSSSTSGIGSSASSTVNGGASTTNGMNGTAGINTGSNNSSSNNSNNNNNSNNHSSSSPGAIPGAGDTLSRTNLYIRGLPQNTSDKDLLQLCGSYGTIISTKAILDKNTNKCKGYGFVDFESPYSAEQAVKALQTQGIQAQMAKCTETNRFKSGSIPNHCVNPSVAAMNAAAAAVAAYSSTCSYHPISGGSYSSSGFNRPPQQEQDPTNLYIANLPPYMAEQELESLLSPYGTVISTRILRDGNHQPRGVGFARMDAKDKCDLIIQAFNGKALVGCKEPLLVKFADGGNKKKSQNRSGGWGDDSGGGDHPGMHPVMHYGQSMGHNGHVAAQLMGPGVSMAAAAAQYGHQSRQFQQASAAAAAQMQANSYGSQAALAAAAAAVGFGPRQYQTASAASANQMQQGTYAAPNGYQTRPYAAASPHQVSGYPGQAGPTASQQSQTAAMQSTHPWLQMGPTAAPQYHLVQSPPGHMPPAPMIPSQTLQALHLSALMPQISQMSAQMSQMTLSGAQYPPQYMGGPGGYPSGPSALYAAQGAPLIQQVQLSEYTKQQYGSSRPQTNGGTGGGNDGQGGSGSSSVGPQEEISSNGKSQQSTQSSSSQQQSYQQVSSSQSK